MQQMVVWTLESQRYALPLSAVFRVVRAVEVTPMPDAPAFVCGLVNVQGHIVPVLDMRARLHLPGRDIKLSDQLIIAYAAQRMVAFFVDGVSGEFDYIDSAVINTPMATSGGGCISAVVKLNDGLILIHDLNHFWNDEQENTLEKVLGKIL